MSARGTKLAQALQAQSDLVAQVEDLQRRLANAELEVQRLSHDDSDLREALARQAVAEECVRALEIQLYRPETLDFLDGVRREAAHQRARWGSAHDAGKTPADWFWLLGYLGGKALENAVRGNLEKARHHTISAAAALANWHAATLGQTDMQPRIDTPTEAQTT